MVGDVTIHCGTVLYSTGSTFSLARRIVTRTLDQRGGCNVPSAVNSITRRVSRGNAYRLRCPRGGDHMSGCDLERTSQIYPVRLEPH